MPTFVMDELSKSYMQVEYAPVEISTYEEGNSGIPYVWTFDSGHKGPHAMVCGIMHGNEIAGAAILDRLMRSGLRPTRGKLTFCFGNPEAYERFDPGEPYQHRYVDTDINRVWGAELHDEKNQDREVLRARRLRPLVESVDYLLDIHTMQGRGEPVALIQGKPAALSLISKITKIPFVLTGKMHQADRLRLRDFSQFGDPDSRAVAIQVEAGQHWEAGAIDEGEAIALQFLECVGILHPNCTTTEQSQKQLEVVEIVLPEGGQFEYADDFRNGTFFPEKGALLGYSGPTRQEVRSPVDNCYFIMPVHFRLNGGSCGRFAREISGTPSDPKR